MSSEVHVYQMFMVAFVHLTFKHGFSGDKLGPSKMSVAKISDKIHFLSQVTFKVVIKLSMCTILKNSK